MSDATPRIDVYWMRTDAIDPDHHLRLLELLSDNERDAHDRLAQAQDRRLHVAAHALKRFALTRRFGGQPTLLNFLDGTHGKPRLSNPPDGTDPRFNLSHTPGLVAVAVSDGLELGLDIEALDPAHADMDTAHAFAHPVELRQLDPNEPDFVAAFYKLWTRKEALAKATGLGLSLDVRQLIFDDEIQHDWDLNEIDITPNHRLALIAAHSAVTSVVNFHEIGADVLVDSLSNRIDVSR